MQPNLSPEELARRAKLHRAPDSKGGGDDPTAHTKTGGGGAKQGPPRSPIHTATGGAFEDLDGPDGADAAIFDALVGGKKRINGKQPPKTGPGAEETLEPKTELAEVFETDFARALLRDHTKRGQDPRDFPDLLDQYKGILHANRKAEVEKYITEQGWNKNEGPGKEHFHKAMDQFERRIMYNPNIGLSPEEIVALYMERRGELIDEFKRKPNNGPNRRLFKLEDERLKQSFIARYALDPSDPAMAADPQSNKITWLGWTPTFARTFFNALGIAGGISTCALIAGAIGVLGGSVSWIAWIAPGLGVLAGIWVLDKALTAGLKRIKKSFRENITDYIVETAEAEIIDPKVMEKNLHVACRRYCHAVGGDRLVGQVDSLINEVNLWARRNNTDPEFFKTLMSANQNEFAEKIQKIVGELDNFQPANQWTLLQQPLLRRILGKEPTNTLSTKWRWMDRNVKNTSIREHLSDIITYAVQGTRLRILSESKADEDAKIAQRRSIQGMIKSSRLAARDEDDLEQQSFQGLLTKWKFQVTNHVHEFIDKSDLEANAGWIGANKSWKGKISHTSVVLGTNALIMAFTGSSISGQALAQILPFAWACGKAVFIPFHVIPAKLAGLTQGLVNLVAPANAPGWGWGAKGLSYAFAFAAEVAGVRWGLKKLWQDVRQSRVNRAITTAHAKLADSLDAKETEIRARGPEDGSSV